MKKRRGMSVWLRFVLVFPWLTFLLFAISIVKFSWIWKWLSRAKTFDRFFFALHYAPIFASSFGLPSFDFIFLQTLLSNAIIKKRFSKATYSTLVDRSVSAFWNLTTVQAAALPNISTSLVYASSCLDLQYPAIFKNLGQGTLFNMINSNSSYRSSFEEETCL